MKEYLALFRTPTFLLNTAGMAAVTFATGAYAAWGSTFYQTVRGMTATQAGVWIGGLTAAAGLIGIAFGTWMADFLPKFTRRAYLLMASAAVVAAVPLGTLAILDPDRTSSLALLFFAMVVLASVLGPCNTVTANVVPANQRAAGYALSIFLIHLFGDISSPILIGYLSDLFGKPSVAGSTLGQILAAPGRRAGGQDEPDRRHARGRPRPGPGLRLLPPGLPPPARRHGSRPQAWRRRGGFRRRDALEPAGQDVADEGIHSLMTPGGRGSACLGAAAFVLGTLPAAATLAGMTRMHPSDGEYFFVRRFIAPMTYEVPG